MFWMMFIIIWTIWRWNHYQPIHYVVLQLENMEHPHIVMYYPECNKKLEYQTPIIHY